MKATLESGDKFFTGTQQTHHSFPPNVTIFVESTGQVPWEELSEAFGRIGLAKIQKWLDGQTVGEIGPYWHDIVRYLNNQPIID